MSDLLSSFYPLNNKHVYPTSFSDFTWFEQLEERLAPAVVEVSLVKDILPPTDFSDPRYLTEVNDTLFFITFFDTRTVLWKSDGTSAGTIVVKDFGPGVYWSDSRQLTNVDGTLFFIASDGTNGYELWKSDGTCDGTVMVKDIWPEGDGLDSANLTNFDGTLFFTANDGVNGIGLWKSDGTCAGTVPVSDIGPSNQSWMNVNGTLFFTASGNGLGRELWKSDGTCAGTVLVKDIKPGISGSNPSILTNFNGTLFFRANDGNRGIELWKSDGTCAGTVLVKDTQPGSGDGMSLTNLTNVNGTLLFIANNGTNGHELWKSDGTSAGTRLVKDIQPGNSGSSPSHLTNVNGTLFFRANEGIHGWELWKSNGNCGGTVLVKDIQPGSASASLHYFTNVDGTLFFTVGGDELWQSDGTSAGTVLINDIQPESGFLNPGELTNVNGTMFFPARSVFSGYQLWKAVFVPDAVPVVTDVFVAGSGWTPAFLNHLEDEGLGEVDFGYRLPTGSASQLATLPWTNLNQISIRFDQDVPIAFEDLDVYGLNPLEYALDPAGFSYDASTFTATWTLAGGAVISNDKILLRLDDNLGGIPLDGEWTDTVSTESGDGTAGGEFHFRFNVLPGDVDQSNGIFAGDVLAVRDAQFQFPGQAGYSPLRDVDGSGTIFANDVLAARDRQFTFLPGGEPEIPEGDEGFLDDDLLLLDSAALVAADGTLADTSPPVQRTARDLLFTSASAGDLTLWTGEAATTTTTPVRTAEPPAENTVSLTRRRGSGGTPAIAVAENLQSPVLG